MVRVAINGFGRIGRQVLRAGISDGKVDFVGINDLSDVRTLVHLLKFDSVYGRFSKKVSFNDKEIIVGNKRIRVFCERNPEKLPWKKLKVDVVVESSGVFLSKELASKHLKAGARRVLLSAPGKGGVDFTVVKGVNDKGLKSSHRIVSNGSCTTNSLAPVLKVINDSLGVVEGFMTTVHAYTNDQRLLDLPHSDLRRARAAGVNSVPTSTGAAKSIGEVIPELDGLVDGTAIRVPVVSGSITEVVCKVGKRTSVKSLNKLFEVACKKSLKGILEYSEEELVSSDVLGNVHSGVFDSKLTKVLNGSLVKVFVWYDNEVGFSNRMIDVLKIMK